MFVWTAIPFVLFIHDKYFLSTYKKGSKARISLYPPLFYRVYEETIWGAIRRPILNEILYFVVLFIKT